MRDVSPPWSSALAAELARDRQRLLVALVELRSRLQRTTGDDFAGGEAERADVFAQTEHDYVALVEAGAAASRLQAELEAADREATPREGRHPVAPARCRVRINPGTWRQEVERYRKGASPRVAAERERRRLERDGIRITALE